MRWFRPPASCFAAPVRPNAHTELYRMPQSVSTLPGGEHLSQQKPRDAAEHSAVQNQGGRRLLMLPAWSAVSASKKKGASEAQRARRTGAARGIPGA